MHLEIPLDPNMCRFLNFENPRFPKWVPKRKAPSYDFCRDSSLDGFVRTRTNPVTAIYVRRLNLLSFDSFRASRFGTPRGNLRGAGNDRMAPSGDANRKKDTLDMKSDESRTTANMEDQSVTDIDTKLIRYRGALVEAVYQYIRTNPGATADEIAEAINESSGEITSTLVKLLEQKRIRVNS
jgi:hypothetical protein